MATTDTIEQPQGDPQQLWFYLIGEEYFGPLSTDELRAALRSGELTRDTLVFREGLTAWTRVGDCSALEARPACSKSVFLWWPESLTGSALLSTTAFCLFFGMWVGAGEFLNGAFSSAVLYAAVMGSRAGVLLLLNVVRSTSKLTLNKPATIAFRQPVLLLGLAVGVLVGSVLFVTLGYNSAIQTTGVVFFMAAVGCGIWACRQHLASKQSQAQWRGQDTVQHANAGTEAVELVGPGRAGARLGSMRKIGWGAGILCAGVCVLWVAGWIVSEIGAAQASRQAELRRQMEEQRAAEEQRQQAANPEMRRQTLNAWKQIQTVEASFSELCRQQASPETLFSKRAYLFTQVDLDHADPLLVQWVRDSIANANGFLSVVEQVAAEQRKTAEFNQAAETFFRVLGAIAGGMANNDRSAQDNIQVGQVAGELVGKGSSLLMNSATTSDVEKNYGPQFGTLNGTRNRLAQQRKELGSYLSEKYGANLLDAN